VSQILATNALDIQAVTQQGFSALYLAAKANHADVVRVLLAGGADPNLKDGHGQTALHRACEDSFEAVAADLIAHTKTDLDAADLMGRTPLHWACSRGPVRLVSQLLERGANLLKTKGGETAVHWATRSGNDDIVALLLKHFPFVNVYDRNERGESSIDLSQGNDNIRGLLLAHADSLGYSDKSSGTQINTQEQIATMVKPIAPSNPKGKKITIKMKPPTK
jgi:ankyrin repeat protein